MAVRLKVVVVYLLNLILFTFSVPVSAWLEDGARYGNEFTSTEKSNHVLLIHCYILNIFVALYKITFFH